MKYKVEKNGIMLYPLEGFSLSDTLDCGQCFRFSKNENGIFSGITGSLKISAKQNEKGETFFYDISEEDFLKKVVPFFDFQTNYDEIKKLFSKDDTLNEAIKYCGGIRILRQEPWEALCSFIISQNNNIERIKGIIARLCENFGEKTKNGYLFPTPQRLKGQDLSSIRAGFRDKYIADAVEKVLSGEINLFEIDKMSYTEALEALMKIKGVGVKVANCVLLYGFHKIEAFPVDVWIKRVLDKFYKNGFPKEFYGFGGIAQQYLFHYIRTQNISIE